MGLSTDFIGFTYKETHSSELGILRVSNSDRYDDQLSPSFEDQTEKVPGGDGSYLFGTSFNARALEIFLAFDSVDESGLYKIANLFGDQTPGSLIFDERPYKVYQVKPAQPLKLSYVPFYEEGARVYKGEGILYLVAYSPFARSRYKYLEDYSIEGNMPEWEGTTGNIDEWLEASGIRSKGLLDVLAGGKIPLWNPGVRETDYILKIPFVSGSLPLINISITGDASKQLIIDSPIQEGTDWGIQINTKLNLIEGIDSAGKITGNVYNKYHNKGHFFKIPKEESSLTISGTNDATIEYDYLYY